MGISRSSHRRTGPTKFGTNLAAPLGITLTAVAQPLLILEECGLAHAEKARRVRTCRIGTAGFDALENWVRDHRSLWEHRLDRLGALLAEGSEAKDKMAPD